MQHESESTGCPTAGGVRDAQQVHGAEHPEAQEREGGDQARGGAHPGCAVLQVAEKSIALSPAMLLHVDATCSEVVQHSAGCTRSDVGDVASLHRGAFSLSCRGNSPREPQVEARKQQLLDVLKKHDITPASGGNTRVYQVLGFPPPLLRRALAMTYWRHVQP
jgi:hypothetical protein